MNLSNSQEKAFKEIKKFLNNENKIFILRGYAGTGKTTLIKYLSLYLSDKKIPFELMASTGRAAKIATDTIGIPAYTIHKSIYSMDDIEEKKITNEDGSETFKYFYSLSGNESSAKTLYIVDEASMVSNVFSEGEFFVFGSGLLLQDLFKFSNKSCNRKILFIGDNAQLPPINMSFSPALNANYIKKEYNFSTNSYELTDVLRQNKESGIIKNATAIRNRISKKLFNKFSLDFKYDDFNSIDDIKEAFTKYLDLYKSKPESEPIMIAFSNKSVLWYNQTIRNYIFNKKYIQKNDKILVIRNNYKYGLLNGQLGKIESIKSEEEIIPINLSTKDGKKIIKLSFINAEILISDIKKTPITLPVKLLLNALESDESALSSEEQRALYVFFRMRMKEKNIKPKTEEYKNAIKDDIYFNALIIKYGYAITCHKSQGGEWSDIFIDMNTHSNVLSESYYRWAYTAITRSNKNVHCLNVPHINIFGRNLNQNKIIESKNNIEKEKILSLNNEIPHSNKKMEIKTNNLLEEEEKLKTKLASILDQENYKIDTMTSIGNYRIRFEIINKNSEKNTIDIIVNGKRKVTKVETKNKELENKLKSIMGFKLIDNSNIDRESHQQFIKSLKEEMPINISIENIEVKTEYQVLLTFQYSNRYQEINFYFDKYGKFKTATCKNNDKINYIIDELKKIIGEKIRLI